MKKASVDNCQYVPLILVFIYVFTVVRGCANTRVRVKARFSLRLHSLVRLLNMDCSSRPISRVLSLDGHLSWAGVATGLTRPTRKHDGPPYRFLFGLAPDGVYRALPVTRKAVGSYPAFPPLPRRKANAAVYFCCTGLGVTSTGRYPASCPMELGLSSQAPFRVPTHVVFALRDRLTGLSTMYKISHLPKKNKNHFRLDNSLYVDIIDS